MPDADPKRVFATSLVKTAINFTVHKHFAMRLLTTLTLFLLSLLTLAAQTVIGERTAELMPENYAITGTATILEYDDGSATLTLSEDFDTEFGPDVWIYLSESLSVSGAVALANLSDLNHFSGELTLDVPAGTDLDANDHVVFYCLAFTQLWASGQFGEPSNPNPAPVDTCRASLTATTDWVTELNLCVSDNGPQTVVLRNNLGEAPGDDYAYLLTDSNEVLLEVVLDSQYVFTELMTSTFRIYGLSYRGTLDAAIGQHRSLTTADTCAIHSGADLFLTVNTVSACFSNVYDEQLAAQTRLYPNPATDQVNLIIPSDFRLRSVSLFDPLGRRVLTSTTIDATAPGLDVSGLPAATYRLLAEGLDGRRFVKSVVVR